MKTGVILCNGEFPKKEYPLYLLRSADVLICCDSARNPLRLKKLGLEPTLIVGDLDSTPARLRAEYSDRLIKIEEQDDNDLAKAFAVMRRRFPEVGTIHILGAGGRSEAHTVGNLGWLMEWERRALAKGGSLLKEGVSVDMVSDYGTAFAISQSAELEVGEGRKISFFSADPTLRIHSEGLEWRLDEVDLSLWWAATLNRASAERIKLSFNHPAPLLIILD